MHFNYIDIIIMVILLGFGIRGYRFGLIRSLFNLVKYIAAIYICKMYFNFITNYIVGNEKIYGAIKNVVGLFLKKTFMKAFVLDTISKGVTQIIVLIMLFVISITIMSLIIKALESLFTLKPLNFLNKLLGFIFGLLKGLVILMILLTITHPIIAIVPKEKLILDLNNSTLLKYLYMYNFVFKYFNNLIEIFNKYNVTGML